MPKTEPFPLLSNSVSEEFTTSKISKSTTSQKGARRRKSCGPVRDVRVGDKSTSTLRVLNTRSPLPRTLRRWKRYAVKHTWVTPLALIGIFLVLFAMNPNPSNPLYYFIFLSYPVPNDGSAPGTPIQYAKGRWDFAFVSFYVIVLSFAREFTMQKLLQPWAWRSGLKSRAKQSRFMEQAYTAIYFGFTGPWGLYIMSRTPTWYFNTRAMYEGFPHKTNEGIFKFYYLFQAAYWAQQAIVLCLGLEKPRKDFKELICHHVVSLALIGLSYRFHFTYMGLGVFITHDISDHIFAVSKTLNYLSHPLVAPYFTFFIFAWCYLRHYLNLRILYSEFNEFKTVGPYELNWEAEQFKCELSHYISTALLAILQALNLFWLFLIIRVGFRYVVTSVAVDERSDNDEAEYEEEQRLDALALEMSVNAGLDSDGESFSSGHFTDSKSRPNGNKKRK